MKGTKVNKEEVQKFLIENEDFEQTLNAFPSISRDDIVNWFFKKSKTKSKFKKLIINTDGAAKGNPGPASAGIVIKNEKGEVVKEIKKYLGEGTNNFAEYMALKIALENLIPLAPKTIEIRMDSELIVKQMNGEYGVKDKKLGLIYKDVCELLENFESYKFVHIPREENKRADQLANLAIYEGDGE